MKAPYQPGKRYRINVDVEPGFESRVRLLAAKWGVKTNVAVQRAVELAESRVLPLDEKVMLQTILTKLDEIACQILP